MKLEFVQFLNSKLRFLAHTRSLSFVGFVWLQRVVQNLSRLVEGNSGAKWRWVLTVVIIQFTCLCNLLTLLLRKGRLYFYQKALGIRKTLQVQRWRDTDLGIDSSNRCIRRSVLSKDCYAKGNRHDSSSCRDCYKH